MAPRILIPSLTLALILSACGGGGGKKSPPESPVGPTVPTIGLLENALSGTTATVVVPLQASGGGTLTTSWSIISGATTAILIGVPEADGRTTMRFATNGTWQAMAQVSNRRGSATRSYTITVNAPVQPALAGQILAGSVQLPAEGVSWNVIWSPVAGVTFPVATGRSGSDGRWLANALIAPLDQVTVSVGE